MPPSSKVRKEEAELRHIAKQSRLARKEATTRERKQRQRDRRQVATGTGAAASAAEVAPTATAPRKRQAALILPSEVAEMRDRLGGTAATPTAVRTPEKKGKKKGSAKSSASVSASTGAPASVSSASSSGSYPAPNYHFEIHYKKKMVMVDVVLHHVPHQKIDISETTATQLVVDTTKHTKKYRLVLPMPAGLRVSPAEATYELESGTLQCRLPIAGGEVPAEMQEQWDRVTASMREQRALRFRTSNDGELTVRTREALLARNPKVQQELHAMQQASRKRGRGVEGEEPAAAEPRELGNGEGVEMRHAPTKELPVKKTKTDVFGEERARALEAAQASAAQVKTTIRNRVQLAKEIQQQRLERVAVRAERKETKQEKRQQSFARVLEEQREQLLARASLNAAVAEATIKRDGVKKAGATSKSVSFVS